MTDDELERLDRLAEATYKLSVMVETQTQQGYWNYDPYGRGLANGLVLGLHVLVGADTPVPLLGPPDGGYIARPTVERHAERLARTLDAIWLAHGAVFSPEETAACVQNLGDYQLWKTGDRR